jgi:hypothetical protein
MGSITLFDQCRRRCGHDSETRRGRPNRPFLPFAFSPTRRFTRAALPGLIALSLANVAAGQLARRGGEFLVNSVTAGNQRKPKIAALPDGGFVVVWQNEAQVAARRFDAETQPVGPEVQVNSLAACFPPEPTVAAAPDGSLLFAWCAADEQGTRFIDAQRFDSSGQPQGGEVRITGDFYMGPNVAAVGTSQFVVTWTSYYEGKAVLLEPNELGSSFQILANGYQYKLAAAGTGGSYEVVWYNGFGSILGRSFHDSRPLGDAFEISHVASNQHEGPVICSHDNGNFVVAWATYGPNEDIPVTYRRYDSDNSPVTPAIRATPDDGYELQFGPTIACGPEDDFAIAWIEIAPNPAHSTFRGRIFTADGPIPSSKFIVAPRNAGTDSLARLSDGDFLLVWNDCSAPSDCDVYGQRFTLRGPTDCPGDCDRDGEVTIDELIKAVNIALHGSPAASMKACLPIDRNLDYSIAVDELVTAVQRSLGGCQ